VNAVLPLFGLRRQIREERADPNYHINFGWPSVLAIMVSVGLIALSGVICSYLGREFAWGPLAPATEDVHRDKMSKWMLLLVAWPILAYPGIHGAFRAWRRRIERPRGTR
jgi:hypothetical protein